MTQELTGLFDKTATLKNKEDFCCLYMEIYYLVMEITEVKEPVPIPMENKRFLCKIWGNSIPFFFFFQKEQKISKAINILNIECLGH